MINNYPDSITMASDKTDDYQEWKKWNDLL